MAFIVSQKIWNHEYSWANVTVTVTVTFAHECSWFFYQLFVSSTYVGRWWTAWDQRQQHREHAPLWCHHHHQARRRRGQAHYQEVAWWAIHWKYVHAFTQPAANDCNVCLVAIWDFPLLNAYRALSSLDLPHLFPPMQTSLMVLCSPQQPCKPKIAMLRNTWIPWGGGSVVEGIHQMHRHFLVSQ